jgi:hypothetical protein
LEVILINLMKCYYRKLKILGKIRRLEIADIKSDLVQNHFLLLLIYEIYFPNIHLNIILKSI